MKTKYEVQTRTVADGWVNCWHDNGAKVYYESKTGAQHAINEFFDDLPAEMADNYDRDDYRVHPVTMLKNGTVLIGLIESEHGEVFVAAETDGAQKYATWQLNPDDGTTFWGHYFTDRHEALADMVERSGGIRI